MGRPQRIEFPGAAYHVIARGNARGAIFLDDVDRGRFLELLGRVAARREWEVTSWCLMGNHYHLGLSTPHGDLAAGMRDLNGAYCAWFNRRHRRVGHVMQGRYRAPLVDRDAYFLAVLRYILRNPVRAMLCEHPGDWVWSSYRATAGLEPAPPLLARDAVLAWFNSRDAVRAFARFVASDAEDAAWFPPVDGLHLGGHEQADGAPTVLNPASVTEIRRRDRQPDRPPIAALLDGDRSRDRLVEAYYHHGYSMSAIARALGVHPATISRRIRSFESRGV